MRRCCLITGRLGALPGDSLQALADKRPVNPLAVAGSADLTAHVDFADLAGVARVAVLGCRDRSRKGLS